MKGDPDSFLANYDALRGLARHIVRDDHDAEDVVQDAWLASEGQGEGGGKPWLRGVTRNLALRRNAGEERRRQITELAAGPAERVDPAEDAARSELAGLLQGLVEGLDEPYRAVVRGRYLEGRGFEELARELGSSPATVRSQLHRGIVRLRDAMDRRHHGERALWSTALVRLFQLEQEGETTLRSTAASAGVAAGGLALLSSARAWAALLFATVIAAGWWAVGGSPVERVVEGRTVVESGEEEVTAAPHSSELSETRTSTAPVSVGEVDGVESPPTAGPVPAEGAPAERADLRRVHVLVVDEHGAPLVGARVHLIAGSRGGASSAGETDAEGRLDVPVPVREEENVRLGNYALGEFSISASMEGRQSSSLHYLTATGEGPWGLEILLPAGGETLRGRVVDFRGVGVGGARVGLNDGAVAAPDSRGDFRVLPYSSLTRTRADGSFELHGLSPTDHGLLVEHPEYMSWARRQPRKSWVGEELTITLAAGVTLTGMVQDEALLPVAGAEVRLWKWNQVAVRSATTERDGSFVLRGLPRGAARLFASSGEPGQGYALDSTRIDLDPRGASRWTATLHPTSSLSIELVTEMGGPLKGWRVQLATEESDWYAALSTDDDGRTGELLDYPREALVALFFPPDSRHRFPTQVIDEWVPEPGTARHEIRGWAADTAELFGSVRQADGKPFSAVHVYLSHVASDLVTRLESDRFTGEFVVEGLPAGEYLVIANAPNGKADLARVELLPGESLDLGSLRAPAVGWLTVDLDWPAASEPESHVLYSYWSRRRGLEPQSMTGGDGIPRRLALMAGSYEVEILQGLVPIQRSIFEVRPGEDTLVRMAPEAGGD